MSDVKLPPNTFENSVTAVYALAFLVPCVAYPAIAFKLWRQQRKICTQTNSEASHTRASHINALRMYASVLVLFVVAYVPTVISGLIDVRSLITSLI